MMFVLVWCEVIEVFLWCKLCILLILFGMIFGVVVIVVM